ncbi:hypothetical protein PR001_g26239 [Phytophthora rubi]|uniref:Uncharacterized protein n=1 Tax=Phytophthora rubi TaxID=129364 RepID=A0A6A3I0H8_9STRA|nr:hypothetical protein PR001_g26239 [Phytophthora rubi]
MWFRRANSFCNALRCLRGGSATCAAQVLACPCECPSGAELSRDPTWCLCSRLKLRPGSHSASSDRS